MYLREGCGKVETQRLAKSCENRVKSVKFCYKTLEKTCFGYVGGWGGLGGFMV